MINLFGKPQVGLYLPPVKAMPTFSASAMRDRAINRELLSGGMATASKYDGRSTRRRIERDMRKSAKKAGTK